MPYTYDTDRAPLWRDTESGALINDPNPFLDTVPVDPSTMTATRAKMRGRASSCRGACSQGRRRCQTPCDCLVRRLEPVPQEPAGSGRALIWLLCLSILLVMVPALIFGVNWADVVSLLAAIGGAL